MKSCVIYARYSCENQTEQSIEGQMTVCTKYAQENGLVIVDTYVDRAMTGTNDNRIAFQQMLKDSERATWEVVLVYAIDRFGRNAIDIALNKQRLKTNGKVLISATQRTSENIDGTKNLDGILLENVYIGIAEYYSAELSQKVKRGMNETQQKGNFTGGYVMFGYRVKNKKVVIEESEATVVRQIFADFMDGKLVTDILADLHEKGILNRGKPFAKNTLYAMLANEKYKGIYRFGEEVFTNIYSQIVSDDVFDFVRNKVESNKYGKHKPEIVYLLKNKVVCGYCGRHVNSDAGTSKNGTTVRYYNCAGRRKQRDYDLKPIRKEILEEAVVMATIEALNNPANIESIVNGVLERNKKRIADDSVLNLLNSQYAETERAISNSLKAIESGIITKSTKERLEELEQQRSEISEKILIEKSQNKMMLTRQDIVGYIQKALKAKPKLMIDLLVKKVVLFNDKIDIYFNCAKQSLDDESLQGFSFYSCIKTCSVEDKHIDRNCIELTFTIQFYV